MKKQNGITLVALSITIIVLLILAGVSIVILIGNNGIITQANNAKDETRGGAVQEARDLWKATQKIDEQTKSETAQTLEKLIDDLVKQKLLTEDEKDQILGNKEKGIKQKGKVTIGSKTIVFDERVNVPELWATTETADKNWYNYSDIFTGEETKVNPPKLLEGMRPIVYENETTSNKNAKWANAMTKDGSMFVWIPRFAYKITYYNDQNLTKLKGTRTNEGYNVINNNIVEQTYTVGKQIKQMSFDEVQQLEELIRTKVKSNYGTIDVVFLKDNTNNDFNGNDVTKQGYIVHPAFIADADEGGGFGEITGIWVAKFRASFAEEATTSLANYESNNGLYNSKYTYTVQIKPGRTVIYGASENEAYKLAKIAKYGTEQEGFGKSHLMKNSEWGAVAYLTYSKYGRGNLYPLNKGNTTLISSRFTGIKATWTNTNSVAKLLLNYNETDDEQYINEVNNRLKSIYEDNLNYSTTRNPYGIYEMHSAANSKYGSSIASYFDSTVSNAISALKSNGGTQEGDLYGATEYERQTSTAYKTVYKSAKTIWGCTENASNNIYVAMSYKGDSIFETSMHTGSNSNASWGNQYSQIPIVNNRVFFARGGTGLFEFGCTLGNNNAEPATFRTVLVCE